MSNNNFSHITFEWKQIDEVILYACHWSKIQLAYELFKIITPSIIIVLLLIILWVYWFIWLWTLILLILWLLIFWASSSVYKYYRYSHNYLYITSKRILFHWLNWFFWDYVKKINYENIRNVNFFTESFIWRIYKYWTLEIQSSHWWVWDITVYHIESWKMLTHYIDKIISLKPEERNTFSCFDPNYFKQ